jgi:hypothetical protein
MREAADRGRLAHALLFTGSGDRVAAARFAAAAMECTAGSGRPCGVCAACRKVLRDIHPDVLTVRDDEHRDMAVDVVRAARTDAYIRPNEGARKVYLFPDCGVLTERDQNVLLKIVEEGPPYAAFLFCAENPAVVLPTLRSRCVELKLRPAADGGGGRRGLRGGGDAVPEPPGAPAGRRDGAADPSGAGQALPGGPERGHAGGGGAVHVGSGRRCTALRRRPDGGKPPRCSRKP